jgi:hypothetical protein
VSLFSQADVATFRSDRLAQPLATLAAGATISDAYLLSKLLAAEAEVSRKLRVKLEPTYVFSDEPTDAQKAALPLKTVGSVQTGPIPYIVEPGYDFDPSIFEGESWGRIDTRQQPIISVDSVQWAYPAPTNTIYTVPPAWLRIDKKYGTIQMVPSGQFTTAPLSIWVLSVLGGGRNVPFMIRINYTCGLADPFGDWPDLIDVIYLVATLKVIEGLYVPQSGSVSGDGLSMSNSFDVQKYRENINAMLFGEKGSNNGLFSAIHGVQLGFGGS